MTSMKNTVQTRQRIIGIVIIIALGIIFLPTFWQKINQPKLKFSEIPARPEQPQVKPINDVNALKLQRPNFSQPHAWSLSLATFTKLVNAKLLLKQLRSAGYPAYMLQQREQSGKFYKVYVGPQIKQAKLQLEAEAIQKKWQLQGKILPFNAIPTTTDKVQ